MTRARTLPLPSQPAPAGVSADTVLTGHHIPAIDRIKIFSDRHWEGFILKWVDSLRDRYDRVDRCGGAGDMGRDVIATVKDGNDAWDHYQCKHYRESLKPADVAQPCKAEAAKTTKLHCDLQTTRTENAAAVERLGVERSIRHAEFEATNMELKSLRQPKLRAAVKNLRDSESRRDAYRRWLELFERTRELEGELAEATVHRKKERADGPSSTVSSGEAEQLSRAVEVLLRTWPEGSIPLIPQRRKNERSNPCGPVSGGDRGRIPPSRAG